MTFSKRHVLGAAAASTLAAVLVCVLLALPSGRSNKGRLVAADASLSAVRAVHTLTSGSRAIDAQYKSALALWQGRWPAAKSIEKQGASAEFMSADADGDGVLSKNEYFTATLSSMSTPACFKVPAIMDEAWARMDKDHDAALTPAEYDAEPLPEDMAWYMKVAFNASDADGDGLLNATEFAALMACFKGELLHNKAEHFITWGDEDNDDKLSMLEYSAFINHAMAGNFTPTVVAKMFDVDGDGSATAEEIHEVLDAFFGVGAPPLEDVKLNVCAFDDDTPSDFALTPEQTIMYASPEREMPAEKLEDCAGQLAVA